MTEIDIDRASLLFLTPSLYVSTDGRKYIGEYREGKRNGMGRCFYADGSKYEARVPPCSVIAVPVAVSVADADAVASV